MLQAGPSRVIPVPTWFGSCRHHHATLLKYAKSNLNQLSGSYIWHDRMTWVAHECRYEYTVEAWQPQPIYKHSSSSTINSKYRTPFFNFSGTCMPCTCKCIVFCVFINRCRSCRRLILEVFNGMFSRRSHTAHTRNICVLNRMQQAIRLSIE